MTRAGEKLYSGWETASRRSIRWIDILRRMAILITFLMVTGAALFGFG